MEESQNYNTNKSQYYNTEESHYHNMEESQYYIRVHVPVPPVAILCK